MSKFQGLAVSLVSFIICIIFVEIFLWIFVPVSDPYNKSYPKLNQYIRLESRPNERFVTELEAELPGADGKNVFSTNNMGFRGDYLTSPKPENEYRIFIVGASNAQCFYLDDSESLDAVLQKELQKKTSSGLSIKVYNAAQTISGTNDVISMIVHRITHLSPDMIIVFSADLYGPIRNQDYLHYLKDTPPKKIPFIHFLATEFQIPRRVYYLLKNISPSEQEVFETVSLKTKNLEAIKKLKSIPVSDEKPKTNTAASLVNLRTIIGTAKAHKVQVVFMTPASTWNSKIDPESSKWQMGLYYNGIRYREDLMDMTLETYNDLMRQLSVEYSVPLYDLARIIPKSTDYFYDDAHFNVKGAEFAGHHLASFMIQEKLIRR